MSLWLLFAALALVGKVGFYGVQKSLLNDTHVSGLELGYITSLYGFIVTLPVAVGLYWQNPSSLSISSSVLAIILGLGVLEFIGLWVYLHALSLADIGVVSPLKRLKTLFTALAEPFILTISFVPSLVGAALVSTLGGYILLAKMDDVLAPFKELTKRGPALALLSAVIYMVLSLGSRFGNTRLNPFVFGALIFGTMTVCFRGSFTVTDNTLSARRALTHRPFLMVGVLGLFRSIPTWYAYRLAPSATEVGIVLQLTILFDVLVGGAFLGEGNTLQRVLGATLIFGGVVLALLI